LADDEVVDEADLHQPGGFGDAAGEIEVGAARRRVAGGVVVEQDEAVGVVGQGGAEDVARVGGGLGEGADADAFGGEVAEAAVDQRDDEVFAVEVGEFRAEEIVDALGAVEADGLGLFAGGAGAEFEGGGEQAGLGRADSAAAFERRRR
jgi:hypothetical protein